MNKVILMGRLTRDVELKTTTSGISVAQFTLAVDRRFKSKSGEREVDFINCTAWRQTAEFLAKYFSKGSKVATVGTISTDSYEKDGTKIYKTFVTVEEAYFVESASASQPADNNQTHYTSKQPPKALDTLPDNSELPFDL